MFLKPSSFNFEADTKFLRHVLGEMKSYAKFLIHILQNKKKVNAETWR